VTSKGLDVVFSLSRQSSLVTRYLSLVTIF
jgi:hypothetical protein